VAPEVRPDTRAAPAYLGERHTEHLGAESDIWVVNPKPQFPMTNKIPMFQ